MPRSKKLFSLNGIILLIVLLINGIILEAAYTDNQNLYWALSLSIPLLGIAIYYAKQKKYVILPDNTIEDIRFGSGYVRLKPANHLIYKSKVNTSDLTVLIGNHQCTQPYNSGILSIGYCIENRNNIKRNSIKLSKMFAFSHDLIESETDFDDLNKPDIILQISVNHLGRENENRGFNFELFREKASSSEVKMIVLKLAPAANLKGKRNEQDSSAIESGCMETIFFNPEGMVLFLDKLRQLSKKKPVGINIQISNKKEFYEICYAIRKTKIIPDFIIVEGCGNNGKTVPSEFEDHIGMPLYDALLFVSKTIENYGLNKEIKIIASGNICSGFEVLKLLALGANAICVQHTPFQINKFGIDNSIPLNFLTHTLYNLHGELARKTIAMMKTCGYKNINDVTLSSFFRCMSIESKRADEIYHVNSKIISIEKQNRNLKSQETSSAMSGKTERIHKQITM
jgi:hypothetical protein